MALPTQTATLGQVFTRYAYNKVGGREYKDNKYKTKPLLKLLTERQLSGDGGESIVHPVNLGTSYAGSSLSRNETFSITGDSNETWARYTWKTVFEPCFVSWWDIREARNSGRGMTKTRQYGPTTGRKTRSANASDYRWHAFAMITCSRRFGAFATWSGSPSCTSRARRLSRQRARLIP